MPPEMFHMQQWFSMGKNRSFQQSLSQRLIEKQEFQKILYQNVRGL